jgi:trimeric autotransporter adhesin
MQTWARRGLRTALITGGLLMLGTGIASANENVNPDRPASPLDPQLKVPVRVHDNAIGTPWGQKDLPNVKRDVVISADALTKGLPVAKAAPVLNKAQGATAPLADKLPQTSRVTPSGGDLFHGNKVTPGVIVPIEFAGNAIAAGGDAHVDASSSETDVLHTPVWTDGSDSALAGNVVNLDWAAPIRISGNAVAVLGKATTHFVSENTTIAGGDIVTNGDNGVLAGNVLSGQLATPAQVTANAVALGGIAKAFTEMDDEAHAPGTITTSGDNGVVSGTGAGAPVALPAAVHGNAVSGAGKAWVQEENDLVATAGQALAKKAGDYISTSGKKSVLSGTVVEPAVATAGTVTCDAVTVLGSADCVGGDTETITKAGGSTSTNGDDSAGGGSIVAAAVAAPAQVFANSVAGGGLTNVSHHNTDISKAGGNSVTSGKDAVLAGTNANGAVSGPVEVFGNAVAALGKAKTNSMDHVFNKAGGHVMTNGDNAVGSGTVANPAVALPAEVFGQSAVAGGIAEALVGEKKTSIAGGDAIVHSDNAVLGGNMVTPAVTGPAQVLSNTAAVLGRGKTDVCNDIETTAGGYTGTTGNDSTGSGNAIVPAVALPGEVLGNGANLGGLDSSSVDEKKKSTAGGTVNTNDDAGVLSSNAAVASLTGPVQVFGNAANAAGISIAKAVKNSTVQAGGPVHAKGTGGAGSGNVANAPIALPTQAFGLAASVLGKATAVAIGNTSSTSGGGVLTDGKDGTINGNVASLPGAGVAQVFGSAAGVAGIVKATGENTTDSKAGGDTTTSGEGGSISGNVASAQPLPIAQVFGLAAAGTGLVNAGAPNDTVVTSGGDITTNGDRGSISGNLADVPAAAVAQVFGNAAAIGGTAIGVGPNETTAITGGTDTTSGKGGNLSGNLATVPMAAIAQVFGNAASVVGNAVGVGTNETTVLSGGDASTSGEYGSISGNLFAVPVAAVAQVFGNAASLGGHAVGIGPNETTAIVGGAYETDGPMKTLSGIKKVVPLGAVVQVFNIPVPIVAHALTAAPNNTLVKVDDTAPLIDLPIGGGGLAVNKLPRLPGRGVLPHKPRSRTDAPLPINTPGMSNVDVAGLPGSGPSLPGLNVVPNIGGTNVNGVELPNVQDVTNGSAIKDLDATQTLPTLNVLKTLPTPDLGLPVGQQSRTDAPLPPLSGPSFSNVDVAGLPGRGPSLPNVNFVPNVGGTNVNGVELPNVQDVTNGSALSSLDATQTLPTLNVVKTLPVAPELGGLPKLT